MKAILALEDGTTFEGSSIGATGTVTGEMCCDTSVMGYQEILTDPALSGRVLAMTYPLIGNYGVCEEDNESSAPQAAGLVVTELARLHCNWRAEEAMEPWLQRHNIVGIAGIDTRKIATLQRNKGTLRCCITTELSAEEAIAAAQNAPAIETTAPVAKVSCTAPYHWEGESRAWKLPNKTQGDMTTYCELPPISYKVVVYDLGVRRSILRSLRQTGCDVTVVPFTTSAADVLAMQPDAVVLSDGPGAPAALASVAEQAAILADKLPVAGIGLGCQVLAMSQGAQCSKLRVGHQGCNQPVKLTSTSKVNITTQNSIFAIDAASLPAELTVTAVNLNDDTVAALRSSKRPIFGVQYLPAAPASADDADNFYNELIQTIKAVKAGKYSA
ncbi:MAG: glutamine-hydrolyzing carbamoyl-phosphate synthase small subunit [Akkermansia sp.]|nr:glutamine-hydrolyzing carbamoyl-phosphate synthase small subunit [Akkermansia sp.]